MQYEWLVHALCLFRVGASHGCCYLLILLAIVLLICCRNPAMLHADWIALQ